MTESRFMDKVSPCPLTGCWWWTATADQGGYGVMRTGGRTQKAHRVSWQLHRGPVPSGLRVLHRCDQPSCVNPDHLFIGTQRDNMRDCAAKGRLGERDTRGEMNGGSRLTDSAVRAIRARYAAGGVAYRELAAAYGVTTMTVCRAINHESWQHINRRTSSDHRSRECVGDRTGVHDCADRQDRRSPG